MAQKSREELLSLFPDIAASLRKLEQADMSGTTGKGVISPGPRRTGHTGTRKRKFTKVVKGHAGYQSYVAVDWAKAGVVDKRGVRDETRAKAPKQGVVLSRTGKRHAAQMRRKG